MERVAIIGAGIIGLSTAYELMRRGKRVVLIDPREPGTAASSGNTGWVVPALSGPVPAPGLPAQVARWMLSPDSPFRIDLSRSLKYARWLYQFWSHCNPYDYRRGLLAIGRLNADAYGVLQRWREAGLEFEWSRDGVLFVSEEPAHIEHVVHDMDALEVYGYQPAEWVRPPLLYELEPALSRSIDCGVLADQEGHVRPESLIDALVAELHDQGIRFVQSPADRDIALDRDRVVGVSAGGEHVEADAFVIAAGAWTGDVGRRFGLRLPVISGKGYSITVDDPRIHLQQPLYLADAKIACTPFNDSNRFAGMMELTGPDESIDPTRLAVMSAALDRYLPGWSEGSRRRAWAGLRPMTPDGLPILGKAPGLDNVYVSSGHGMLGMTMAPVSAEIIADLIVRGWSRYEIAPFRPGRF